VIRLICGYSRQYYNVANLHFLGFGPNRENLELAVLFTIGEVDKVGWFRETFNQYPAAHWFNLRLHLPAKDESGLYFFLPFFAARFSDSIIAIACFWLDTFGPDFEPEWSEPDFHFDMTSFQGIYRGEACLSLSV
jgi:hypothetical protein